MELNKQEAQFEQIIESILANGYGVLDNFFNGNEVNNLLLSFKNRYKSGLFENAKVGKKSEEKSEETIRGDEIHWLHEVTKESAEQAFFQKITAFSNYLNQTCYLGITDSEFHYAKYPIGKFYRRHRDSFLTKKGRVLSIIIYLNINWKTEDGGELVIYKTENGIENLVNISPKAGRIVCFESEKLDHEVLETYTDRLSITGWLLNK